MTTDRHNNRSRRMRSLQGVTSDCSEAGTRELSPPSRGRLRASLLHGNSGLRCRPVARVQESGNDPMPIWLAALVATSCQARVDGKNHAVRWDCIAGRALYTNRSAMAEHIEPLGVQLQGGHTVAVSWQPGETNYTVEVYSQINHFRA
jgi:hypothetical protein